MTKENVQIVVAVVIAVIAIVAAIYIGTAAAGERNLEWAKACMSAGGQPVMATELRVCVR